MSRISCVRFEAKASIEPSLLGTIAMFDVTDPSTAFSVETPGCEPPSGHRVRYPNVGAGTTVALNTYASAVLGGPQMLFSTFTVSSPWNGLPFPTCRVSSTRQGVTAYSDSPGFCSVGNAK